MGSRGSEARQLTSASETKRHVPSLGVCWSETPRVLGQVSEARKDPRWLPSDAGPHASEEQSDILSQTV